MTLALLDIGDRLTLTAPWRFTLHQESRNVGLMRALGLLEKGGEAYTLVQRAMCFLDTVGQSRQSQAPETPSGLHYAVNRYAGDKAHREGDEEARQTFDLARELNAWAPTITLPAETELSVDRVYIRKGAAEFSSYTFYVQAIGPGLEIARLHPTNFKPKHRFWAKIADCRRIAATVNYREQP